MHVSHRHLTVRPRLALGAAALAVAMTGTVILGGPTAGADTAPPPGTPATVSADALPTVQQNGVVWSQVTVGNTVYATGNFSQTWPAGTTNTAANDTARANLLAYDIRTGGLLPFAHTLNAQGLVVAASPDGTRLYVGGDFTSVDGIGHYRLAAFDTATGALINSFAPVMGGPVQALAATNTTVYVGGSFAVVNGQPRKNLAAVTSSGSLTTWAPTADDNLVSALVVTPDQSEVVVGGRFTTLDGVPAYGLGAVTTATGAVVPYQANAVIRDYTSKAGIESLATDGTQVYGSGFAYGAGNFEGTFALTPDTGKINLVNDCHGDTYSVFPVGQVLYSVSHAHDCSAIRQFPDTNPRQHHHALAFTTYPTTTDVGPDTYGWNYNGQPASQLLQWYPTLVNGTFTGQSQAAWSITGNSTYVALGGEFPSVNGVAQQGLVRFAIRAVAPNKSGPVSSAGLTPTATSAGGGRVLVKWTSTWDMDNQTLTYGVYRDGGTSPVCTVTAASNFWTLPALSCTDSGLVVGSTHTYVVKATDPLGNTRTGGTTTVTA